MHVNKPLISAGRGSGASVGNNATTVQVGVIAAGMTSAIVTSTDRYKGPPEAAAKRA
jgi:hypothetical protein